MEGSAPTTPTGSRLTLTSDRERRLWIWTAVVVVAIYASLGLSRTIASELRSRDMLDNTFFAAFLVILAAIAIHGLRRRPGAAEIWIVMGVVSVYVMLFLRMATPEERSHLIEYAVVALLIYEALMERSRHGRPIRRAALLAIGSTAMIGLIDEGIQLVLPFRVFDPIDIGFNTLAAVLAVGTSVALAAVRRRVRR